MKSIYLKSLLILFLLTSAIHAMDMDSPPYFPEGVTPVKENEHEENVWLDPQNFELQDCCQFVIFSEDVSECIVDVQDPTQPRFPGVEPLKIDFSRFQNPSMQREGFLIPMLLGVGKAQSSIEQCITLLVSAIVNGLKIESQFFCLSSLPAVRLMKVSPTGIVEVESGQYEIRHPDLNSCEYHLRKKPELSASQPT